MIECDVSDKRNHRLANIGRVPRSAKPDFDNGDIDFHTRKMPQAQKRHGFKFGRLSV
jgi:hypothetical protein